ncbi:MAG: ABC transporter ATP-binding protein [Clostridia bacterium]|nr:ABC transporter ATP-binding protein [Clostridia bacterium]
MSNIIEISHLNKSFGDVKAVQDLSFQVKKGELFAFLGVNGAGKSTTISILCGQLPKDSGTVTISGQTMNGHNADLKRQLGVVYQTSVLDAPLSVRDNLMSRAALYGIRGKQARDRINQLAELLDFKPILNRAVGKLSGGQRRRVDIARALIHQPQILILDEPTTGLDPQTRKLLWQVIEGLRKESGMTVFLTTHYMEEAADADSVIILNQGKIAANGTPLTLKNSYTGDFISLYNTQEDQVKKLGQSYTPIAGGFRVFVPNTATATELIRQYPDIFTDYEITKGKMDDVFLAVTGQALTGGDHQ